MFIAYPGVNRLAKPNDKLSLNLTPFHTILDMMRIDEHSFFDKIIVNLIGNILGFIPIGFFLPAIFKKFRSFGKFSLFFIGMIIFLELSQMLLHVGVADIDDVILNYLGGILGFLLFKFFRHKF
jgi:glycopeptide antibiotics resistance protein